MVKIGLLTLSAATIGFKHNIKGGCQEYSGSYLFLFLNINTSVNNANNLFLYTTNKKIVLLFLPPSFDDFYLVNKDIRDIF